MAIAVAAAAADSDSVVAVVVVALPNDQTIATYFSDRSNLRWVIFHCVIDTPKVVDLLQ